MPHFIRWTLSLALLPLLAASSQAAPPLTFTLNVDADNHHRLQSPVAAEISLPASLPDSARVFVAGPDGKRLPAQLVDPGLLRQSSQQGADTKTKLLVFILPQLAAGETATFTAVVGGDETAEKQPTFSWAETDGRYADLLFEKRPVVRYMFQAYENDPAKRDLNNKPFHHVYDPAGRFFVTKGSGGQYTHHQGLFYGFTRITFEDGSRCNTWYCHHGEFEQHQKTLSSAAGPVLGRHCTAIGWHDLQGKLFAEEHRELTAYAVKGGALLEWSSRLFSRRGTITLDGDAQHAGFQFRAANEVAEKTKNQTYYLRTDGRDEPGVTRNPPDERMKNMPWHAMSFVLGDERFTAAYIDHPQNPKPSESSERDYGRFGSWFGKYELKEGEPLEITYRIWLQSGEMTGDEVARLAADFAEPPVVTVRAGE